MIHFYRKDPNEPSLFPSIPEEIALQVMEKLPIKELFYIASLNQQGHRLARTAFFNRAKAIGYQGKDDLDQIRAYFYEINSQIKEAADFELLPHFCYNESEQDLFKQTEDTILSLKRASEEELYAELLINIVDADSILDSSLQFIEKIEAVFAISLSFCRETPGNDSAFAVFIANIAKCRRRKRRSFFNQQRSNHQPDPARHFTYGSGGRSSAATGKKSTVEVSAKNPIRDPVNR